MYESILLAWEQEEGSSGYIRNTYCLAVSRYCDGIGGITGTPSLRADIRAPDVTVTSHLTLAMGWLERADPRLCFVITWRYQ